MRNGGHVVVGAHNPPVTLWRKLTCDRLDLRVFSRILVNVQVLDIQRNLSRQLVRRKETLKQNKGRRVVVSTLHRNNVNEIRINLTHKVIYDDYASSAMHVVFHEIDILVLGRLLVNPICHDSVTTEFLVHRLPGGITEDNVPDPFPQYEDVILRSENVARPKSLAATRRTNDEMRRSGNKPQVVIYRHHRTQQQKEKVTTSLKRMLYYITLRLEKSR